MDPIPPPQNISPITSPTPPVIPPKTPNYLIPILGIVLFISLAITAFLIYQNSQVQKRLDQFISENQPTPSPTTEAITPSETPPTPTNPSDWETYIDSIAKFSIQYPKLWTMNVVSKTIIQQDIVIGQIKLIGAEGTIELSFGDGFGGSMCADPEGFNGILVIKNTADTQVNLCQINENNKTRLIGSCADCGGIKINRTSYVFHIKYTSGNSDNNPTIDQILSTFKFLIQNTYTCPINGWVSCMPILTDEAKKACTPEAIDWYKANCPNFQGVAQ
jgi:hypothetical protein